MTAHDDQAGKTPREAMLAALNAPLLASALPIRVATYSLQVPSSRRSAAHSRRRRHGLLDREVGCDGLPDHRREDRPDRREPGAGCAAASGDERRAIALQFAGGASLPPGRLHAEASVAEGDRVGTVEHPIHASLVEGAHSRLSELMVGGPATADLLRPTVGYRVSFGSVQGYVEAYGRDTNQLKVQYRDRTRAHGTATADRRSESQTRGRRADDLQPGAAGSSAASRQVLPARRRHRRQHAGEDLVAAVRGRASCRADDIGNCDHPFGDRAGRLYLPIADEVLGRPFKREIATHSETLRSFRGAVDADGRAAFDKGAGLLAKGDYVQAEESFKSAMGTTSENAAVLAYFAATFAASGHDIEAANAWQTSLVDGSDFPEIYEWLSGALLRTHQMSEARAVLDEATSKWPADQRFSLPRALIFATFGRAARLSVNWSGTWRHMRTTTKPSRSASNGSITCGTQGQRLEVPKRI